jgi:hypothetical protein
VTTAAIEDHLRFYSQAVMRVPAEYSLLPAIAYKCPRAKELAAPLSGAPACHFALQIQVFRDRCAPSSCILYTSGPILTAVLRTIYPCSVVTLLETRWTEPPP